LEIFNTKGVSSSEIVVVVIFDGIDKINNSSDEKSNVLKYFNELDWEFGISEEPAFPEIK
jgi:hypothetical protein